jgi:hypothetical protein
MRPRRVRVPFVLFFSVAVLFTLGSISRAGDCPAAGGYAVEVGVSNRSCGFAGIVQIGLHENVSGSDTSFYSFNEGCCPDAAFYGLLQAAVGQNQTGTFVGLSQFGILLNESQKFYGLLQWSVGENHVKRFWGGVQAAAYNEGYHVHALLQAGIWNDIQRDFTGVAQIGAINWMGGARFFGVIQLGGYNYLTRRKFDHKGKEGMFFGMFQAGGINAVSAEFYAMAQAGALNTVSEGDAMILFGQFGLMNLVYKGDFTGLLQAGAWNNVAGYKSTFQGLAQIGAVNYVESGFYGLGQFGALNLSGKEAPFWGVQAGGVNFVGVLRGLQAGAVNFAMQRDWRGGVFKGGQVGICNFAGSDSLYYGVQVGLCNFAGHVRGVQIGIFNHARSLRGIQLGLANMSSEGGLPFMVALNAGF